MATDSDLFVLTFDLMASYFIDGFLLVQDLYFGTSWEHTNTSEFFQNYFVNVGDDPDYRKNPSCPGAPFMTIAKEITSAQSGWVFDGKA